MISLGLVGYPLTHSLSPLIHKAALNYCGEKGNYALFPVHLDDIHALKALLDRVRDGSIAGLNVTIPHKQRVTLLLDELARPAQAVGAANTIFMRNGKLTGENTDIHGFLADLRKLLAAEPDRHAIIKNALVLGAGGAARAITYALLNDGWKVAVAARRPEQARALIAQFPDHSLDLTRIDYDADAFRAVVPGLSLVVNATPAGMSPDIEKSPWPKGVSLPRLAVVYDLVYTPRVTKLAADARLAGLGAFNGIGMLVEQAAMSFSIWTGFEVPREILFAALEEK